MNLIQISKEIRRGNVAPHLLKLWRTLEGVPAGNRIFSHLVGKIVPYSGSVHPFVLEFAPGRARIRVQDKRANRNHLGSVHAVALLNVAELTSGLALLSSLPPNTRGIVTELKMEYLKKAKGSITAATQLHGDMKAPTGESGEPVKKWEREIDCELTDESGAVVAKAVARWRLACN